MKSHVAVKRMVSMVCMMFPFLWKWGELAPSPVGYRFTTGRAASIAHIHSFTSAIA